jgi:hypothetical protein
MSIQSIVELAGAFENPGGAVRYFVIHDVFSSPKFVPGKHATMITQVGVSPSAITNWANSPRGLVIWDIENNAIEVTIVSSRV